MRLSGPVVRVLAQDDRLHPIKWRGVERAEDPRPRRIDAGAGCLALAQECRKLAHLRTQQPVADARLPGSFQLDAFAFHAAHTKLRASSMRASRSWNRTLVTSRRSSIGLSTKSLAPACNSSD